MKDCIKCGSELPEGATFCPSCGSSAERFCANCGCRIKGEVDFCPDCGSAVERDAPAQEEETEYDKAAKGAGVSILVGSILLLLSVVCEILLIVFPKQEMFVVGVYFIGLFAGLVFVIPVARVQKLYRLDHAYLKQDKNAYRRAYRELDRQLKAKYLVYQVSFYLALGSLVWSLGAVMIDAAFMI